MAFKLLPFSADSVSCTPFSFSSAGEISVPGSEATMAAWAQVEEQRASGQENQECSAEDRLSFAFQCLHSWGFSVTKECS